MCKRLLEKLHSQRSTYVLLCWSSYSEFNQNVSWLLFNTSTKANYSKQDVTAVPFKSYHILFPTVSTQSSMHSIFHASCSISLILWCTLFSWHGRSSGPEALKEECGMGKSEQSQVTKLTDVLTHNLLPCQADMQQTVTVTVTSTTEAFCFFFFISIEEVYSISCIQSARRIDSVVVTLEISHKNCPLPVIECHRSE